MSNVRSRPLRAIALVLMLLSIGSPSHAATEVADGLIALMLGDYNDAFAIFRPLAERGDSAAELQLALLYEAGVGVRKDPENARFWLERAASHDNEEAQITLGRLYMADRTERAHVCDALTWFGRAALHRSPEALTAIGELALAHGGSDGPRIADAWFQKAASFGYADALHHLGRLRLVRPGDRLRGGLTTPPDIAIESHMWLVLASDAALPDERQGIDKTLVDLRETMMPGQVAEAKRAAESWFRSHILNLKDPLKSFERIAVELQESFPNCDFGAADGRSAQ